MSTTALDALGRFRRVPWLILERCTAAVETAAVCGLRALRADELRPLDATSSGVGQALAAAVSAGASRVLVGLGGTAVVDGGAGALAALGARFLDARGRELTPRPGALSQAVRVDVAPARRMLADVEVQLLSDVRTPLAGSIASFGAQKGLTERDRSVAEAALHHLVDLLEDAGVPEIRARFYRQWLGAGGGIGFGLSSVVLTTAGPGAERLLALLDPDDAVGTAALAITGEGKVDATTWIGKLPGAVADRRRKRGLPTAVVAVQFAGDAPGALVSQHPVVDVRPPPTGATGAVTGADLWCGLARAAEDACVAWLLRGSVVRP
jgi:glycerate kinase